MNNVLVKFVGENEVRPATFFAEREFVCWRGREYDELYSCKVSRQGDHYVGLNLDIMPIRFSEAIAEDIARCLYDAVHVTVGNLAGFVPTPTVRDSKLERTFRKRVSGEWSYSADGRFNCHEAEDDVYVVEPWAGEHEQTEAVSIYTIDEGGVELVFDLMGFSFGMLDAVWLANALMEAMGRDQLDTLETISMNCRPMAGIHPAEIRV